MLFENENRIIIYRIVAQLTFFGVKTLVSKQTSLTAFQKLLKIIHHLCKAFPDY